MRIDRPLTEALVATAQPILVVAALPSAMSTAVELLGTVARQRHTLGVRAALAAYERLAS